jgi:DNA-binding response OmpR family regulator
MPSGNGFTLCEQLKQNPRLKETPIIFISGRASLEDQQHGLEMGAIDYIIKPFDSFEFAPRLLSHIKSPRPLNVSDQVADPNAESFGNSPQRNQ